MPSNDQTGKKKKTYNPSRPCYLFGELEHRTLTFPVKIKANDTMLKFKEHTANVESFDTSLSIESFEALLDSGATHSAVGYISFFTSITPTNLILSVASNHKFMVVGIERISLKAGDNNLEVNDVFLF
ncbi:hypothetical protein O181_033736 [Austropuccinia psidii MF-1]|uniref:Uncharacterized protein n=1 Tax=Austropuccinia psidii MF-1 TaxID=1389203 RepID=A0A9Q3H7D1_9BASI|nr:hypothetical protein [Austropuccinia psidii MF-1]